MKLILAVFFLKVLWSSGVFAASLPRVRLLPKEAARFEQVVGHDLVGRDRPFRFERKENDTYLVIEPKLAAEALKNHPLLSVRRRDTRAVEEKDLTSLFEDAGRVRNLLLLREGDKEEFVIGPRELPSEGKKNDLSSAALEFFTRAQQEAVTPAEPESHALAPVRPTDPSIEADRALRDANFALRLGTLAPSQKKENLIPPLVNALKEGGTGRELLSLFAAAEEQVRSEAIKEGNMPEERNFREAVRKKVWAELIKKSKLSEEDKNEICRNKGNTKCILILYLCG